MQKFILILATVSLLSGCASYKKSMPFPEHRDSIKVQIDTGLPSIASQPIGSYIDKKNRLVVTGHQKGLTIGLLFGPIGVLTEDAIARSSGKKQYSEPVSHLNADWNALSTNILSGLLQENPQTTKISFNEGSQRLTLRPYGVLNVHNQPETTLFVVLEATLSSPTEETLWEGRYFVPTEHAYNLTSSQGWTRKSVYVSELEPALKTVYQTLLRQIDSKPMKKNEIIVKLINPYAAEATPIKGQIIGEHDGYVLFQTKMADAVVGSGCYVIKKKDLKLADN